jgi:hypothetical protein
MQLRQRSLAWAFLAANALLAASGFTHPNGDLYFVALVCLVLMYDRGRLQWRYLFISGIPYLIGAAMWVPYVLKAPDLFRIQLLGNMVGRESAFSAPVSTLHRELKRYLDAFGFAPWSKGFAHLSILELLAFLGGVAACAVYGPLRRQSASRQVVTITGAVCLFLWLFEGAKVSSYLLHAIPWFCFALALAVADYWNKRRGPRIVAVAVVGLVFFLALVRIAVPVVRDNYHQRYLPAAMFLRQNASPTDLVMGSAELVFYLGSDWHVLDDIMMGTTTGKIARYIVVDTRYSDYMQSIRVTAPAEYERVATQLREKYDKVYDRAAYQIYQRAR